MIFIGKSVGNSISLQTSLSVHNSVFWLKPINSTGFNKIVRYRVGWQRTQRPQFVYRALSLRSSNMNTTKARCLICYNIMRRLPASDQRSPCCDKRPRAVTKETPALLSLRTLGIYLPGVVAINIYVGLLIVKADIGLRKQLFEEIRRLFTKLVSVEGMWKN